MIEATMQAVRGLNPGEVVAVVLFDATKGKVGADPFASVRVMIVRRIDDPATFDIELQRYLSAWTIWAVQEESEALTAWTSVLPCHIETLLAFFRMVAAVDATNAAREARQFRAMTRGPRK